MRTLIRQKRQKLSAALLLGAVVFIPSAARGQTATGSFERTLTVTGRPDIEVVTGSGRIEVAAGRDGQIVIRGEIRANGNWGWNRSRLTPEERVRRIEANPPIQQNGHVVRIGHIDDRDLNDGVSISYSLTVPSASLLRSKTGSGSQRFEGIKGDIQANTGSGSIVARDVGRLSASAGSGSIEADRIDGPFRANTGSGRIHATAVQGAISAKTGSGSIDVVQAGSGDVDVSASSGSVRLRGIRGGLTAATTSGGLHVQGEPRGDWELSAASGGVRVDVPDGSGFELHATTSSGSIDVGMPVKMTSTTRRSLRGTVHDGGSLMRIRTASGSIDIR